MLKGNKGEWSDVYTLLKILSDTKLYCGDENLKPIVGLELPIIKVIRATDKLETSFKYDEDEVLVKYNGSECKLPIDEFTTKSIELLNYLKTKTGGTFELPDIESFMHSISCFNLKASSKDKSDIKVVVHDPVTGINPNLGFSIKSQIGDPSTLLNAGKTTNFIYQICDLEIDDDLLNQVNGIETRTKIRDRVRYIVEHGGSFKFFGNNNQIFYNNLILIDSCLPYILSEMLLDFVIKGKSRTEDLAELLVAENPVGYDANTGHNFYSYKIKRFLTDIALGMMPSVVWNGILDATGGYLVVTKDGDIICYHIYNRNSFEDYLMKNTKFETASSNRHDFGKLYRANGMLLFKLNLQIRFI